MAESTVATSTAPTPPAATKNTAWQVQFVALAAIWGSSFLFIKVALDDLAPLDVAFARIAIGGLTLFAVALFTRQRFPRDLRLWRHLAVIAVLMNVVPFTLFAYGEQHVSSVVAGIWNGTTPLFVLLFSISMLPGEQPTRERVAGLLAGFAGVLLVLGPWRSQESGELIGHLACMAAAVCYGLGFPYVRRFLSDRPESVVVLSAGQLACATVQTAALIVVLGQGGPGGVSLQTVGAILALGVLGTGIAYPLNYAIVRAAGAGTASTVTYVIPLFSTVLGIVVLGEALSWNQPVGAVVVLVGVAISQGRIRWPARSD
jgi:drug/metabolite transporter (DMT)-like permease